MDDGRLIEAVFNFTCLNFLNGLGYVHGNGTRLRVGHQALGAEDTAYAAYNAHHVGSGDHYVEIEPVFVLDALNNLLCAHDICARRGSRISPFALGNDQNALGFTSAVGKDENAAHLLVGLTGVNAEADVELDSFVELGLCGGKSEVYRFGYFVCFGMIVRFNALCVFLANFHYIIILRVVLARGSTFVVLINPLSHKIKCAYSSTVTPIERAVPFTMLMAASKVEQFKSGSLVLAISST